MDSVSQIALGATIAEVAVGRYIGRRALFVGGFLGTLPDLDVVVQYADAVASFTYHRSWSHSLIVLTLASPLLAWLLHRIHAGFPASYKRWLACVWLILITHPLLDGFTVYGTQLLWPVSSKPVAWGSMFIIDPLYTVPLLVSVVVAWRSRHNAHRAAVYALCASTAYIALSLLSKQHADTVVHASLTEQGLPTENVLVAPFSGSLLWRIVSMGDEQYHEGYYSLLDKSDHIQLHGYDNNHWLVDKNSDHWPTARLNWFTDGFIAARDADGKLVVDDLRMGIEASYVFRFDMGEMHEYLAPDKNSVLLPMELDTVRMLNVFRRVVDESVDLAPDGNRN